MEGKGYTINHYTLRLYLFIFLTLLITGDMLAQSSVKVPLKFLALGDSYTIGESVKKEERWPEQLAVALRPREYNVETIKIIATTGWRTDDLMNAIKASHLKSEFNLVSLLIGVNNQYQGKSAEHYKPEFEELLKVAIQLAGGKKENVFVVSIPDYGFTPFGQEKQEKISKELDAFNAINQNITEMYGVHYVNITDISRNAIKQPELIADDGLHPSGLQYKLWVDRILKIF